MLNQVTKIWIALAFCLMLTSPSIAGDRMDINFEKGKTGSERGLEYEYSFSVRNAATGAPISDAEFMIATDMPAMPGAHHMPHVAGVPTGVPGKYRAKIDFDMAGKWSLILRFTKPQRDQIVLTDHIENYACEGASCKSDHGHMDHSPEHSKNTEKRKAHSH